MEPRTEPARAKRGVYITGVTGNIGRLLAKAFKDEYDLKGNGLRAEPIPGVRVAAGNVRDLEFLADQFQGCDTVIHLAAEISPRASWESCLRNNIEGTYAVYEAACQAGVRRVILASTNHVTGILTEKAQEMDTSVPVRPDGYYGVSKAFGEILGRYYSDRFGISALNFRIGWFIGERPEREVVDYFKDRRDAYPLMWLSPGDCVEAFRRGIEAPASLLFGTYYIMSNNRDSLWDQQNAREELGFVPRDDLGALFDRYGVPYHFRIPREGAGG